MSAAERKPRGLTKRETRKMAAVDFEPWSADVIGRMTTDFSGPTWSLKPDSPTAVDLRLATVILSKTKSELVEAARSLDVAVFELIEHLGATAKGLRALADIVDGAAARQQAAAAVVTMEHWGEGNDLRWASPKGAA